MTPADFDAAFDQFQHTAYRLEALPRYQVGGVEEERFQAWLDGQPLPERSIRTNPWVARIATSTAAGRVWTRTRAISAPMTDYETFELIGYAESLVVGEATSIVLRSRLGDIGPDFWLLDGGLPTARGIVMRYDEEGHWLGMDDITDPAQLAEMQATRERVERTAVPLNTFLAGLRG